MLHLPLLRYKELIMLPKYSFISMLDAITQHRIKELILAPPILIRLVSDPVVRKYDLSFVRRFSSGSAPLPPEILKRLQTTFPKTGFKQGYGMTETCSCVTAHDPSHYDYKFATTCGVILSNTEVKFVDEEGAEVAEGEILVKGPQCALGYLHNEQATQELFDSEGWLRTGDKGYLDPDGCLVVTGRLKDLIKVKGVGVSPVELEDLLLQHPKVRDVCILGHSHPYSGQVPHAYIVLQNGEIGNAEVTNEIVQFVQGRKARPKWLDGVTYIQEVPRAGNGKILRKDLQKKIRLSGVRL
jgi:acyl-CoA synthetase (AMP-forming)/AMP-acid ligase II